MTNDITEEKYDITKKAKAANDIAKKDGTCVLCKESCAGLVEKPMIYWPKAEDEIISISLLTCDGCFKTGPAMLT